MDISPLLSIKEGSQIWYLAVWKSASEKTTSSSCALSSTSIQTVRYTRLPLVSVYRMETGVTPPEAE